ncbi:hemolysin family protein [Bacillus sp. 165]|uniref:hemolysin family protein n=1 Tax=Bacillus sp. 165 TaxID=1529117 RepID=UPI001ADA7718|nr:hemolysin family protein [Bacillus sp. 165]MBO9128114.1 HlyC/CorC family transporter [Bacillus sp. 165]
MNLLNLLLVGILILISGFFVASEFAVVKVRKSRIDQLANEGHKSAIAARTVISNLDVYLSACQLGITITSLGLGWLGEPTVQRLLTPVFEKLHVSDTLSHTLSFIISFSSITFLHVVLGELVPKSFAILKAEQMTLLFGRPLMIFYKVMFPFIWILNTSASFFTRLFGLEPASEHELAHSEEELRLILSESYKSGEITQVEYRYVNNIFEFDDRLAKEIMVPRTEMVCLSIDNTMEENINIITKERYTRYPIIGKDKDDILGIVNTKEITHDKMKGIHKPLEQYIHPALSVFETVPIKRTLIHLQKKRAQMAIIMDEYGGTAGLLTMEDIIEEIIGEIQDEFDIDELPMIEERSSRLTIVDGKVLISEINDLFGLHIDDSDLDTIGGWFLSQSINVNVDKGHTIQYAGYNFQAHELDGYQIKRIAISKIEKASTQEGV